MRHLTPILDKLNEIISESTIDYVLSTEETKKPEESPEEYNGIDYITWTEFKDGTEKHYRKKL